MTNSEKSNLVKLYTLVGLVLASLGAAAGWGAAEATGVRRMDEMERRQERYELRQESHSQKIQSLELIDARRDQELLSVDEKLDGLKEQQGDILKSLQNIEKRLP